MTPKVFVDRSECRDSQTGMEEGSRAFFLVTKTIGGLRSCELFWCCCFKFREGIEEKEKEGKSLGLKVLNFNACLIFE